MSESSAMIAGLYSREEVATAIAASGGPRLTIGDRIPGGASSGAWLARDEDGRSLVLKVLVGEDHLERMGFQVAHLPKLSARGLPVPRITNAGPITSEASYLVYPFIRGTPAETVDETLLGQILELVEGQAAAGVEATRRDWSRWMQGVLFEGWEDWWELVSDSSPEARQLCEGLRVWVNLAEGDVLPSDDFIHGNFHQGQVLVRDDLITGIVDWDHLAIGSRAIDLGSLLVAWYVLRRLEAPNLAKKGAGLLAERVTSLTGEPGLRQIVGYHVLAGCWFWRRDEEQLRLWVKAGADVMHALTD